MLDPVVERELEMLRAEFKAALLSHTDLVKQRDELRADALKIALATNDRRLDGMNEFRQALNDQGMQMITRQESEAGRLIMGERVEQNRVSTELRIEMLTRPKWTLMLSLFSICLVLVTGAWVVTGLKVDSSVAPVALLSEQTKVQVAGSADRMRILETTSATSTQADVASRGDRAQLNERLSALETSVASNQGERRSQFAVMSAKLVEIETQFCASDIVRNLLRSDDMRIRSVMWAKLYPGEKMPTDNSYYPRICNRASTSE